MAKINNALCKELGIKRSVTSAYHPQTNGLHERTNQTLKAPLSKLVNEKQDVSKKKPKSKTECLYATSNGDVGQLVMGILRGNSWLSDEHIVHAQWLLKKQYLGTNGLHSVLAFEGKKVATEGLQTLCMYSISTEIPG